MFDLRLTTEPAGTDALTAGYSCPCGCTPATTYRRGERVASDSCCCGNEFAVGPEAEAHVHARSGYAVERQAVAAPWGEQLPVMWAIGPSTHDEGEHAMHAHHPDAAQDDPAIDPVCGMTVDPVVARTKDLTSNHAGVDYFFCGKGCKLEFGDDPDRYLDPSFIPSM